MSRFAAISVGLYFVFNILALQRRLTSPLELLGTNAMHIQSKYEKDSYKFADSKSQELIITSWAIMVRPPAPNHYPVAFRLNHGQTHLSLCSVLGLPNLSLRFCIQPFA